MKTFYVLILGLSLTVLRTAAQTPSQSTIMGEVKDASGKALEFVTILLVRAGDSTLVKGAVSDTAGKYQIDHVTTGAYRVAVSQVGYGKTYSAQFQLEAEKTYTVPTLHLKEDARTLAEVKVTAQKPFIEQLPDKTVVNVESSIIAAGGNALEVLEKAPGVLVDQQNDRLKLKGREGVLIMIDGKPTYLSAAEVMNLLRNTPSNSVQSIELITKPSAKYDAAGNSGIINIRLKRNNTAGGTNGSIMVGTGYGRFAKANTGLTLNHRQGAWSLFGNYNYDYRKSWQDIDVMRWLGSGATQTRVQNLGYRPYEINSHTFKLGTDFTPGKNNTFGLMLNGMLSDNVGQINNNNLIYNANDEFQGNTTFTNSSKRDLQRLAANANYKHTFDSLGREITVDLDYSKVETNTVDNMTTRQFNAGGEAVGQPLRQRNSPPSWVTIQSVKLDYVHPLGKGAKLEAGWKTSYVTTDNDVKFETLQGNNWQIDTARTNHFVYNETIHAAYVSGSSEWQKWSLQGGLRMEHTESVGNSITLNKIVDRQYTNLFPSAFLTYKLSENHQFRTSYSRRIDRPSYFDLNPFIYMMDAYTYRQGNPFLQPQYTNAFEVGYTYKNETTITLSYNRTSDVITQGNEQIGETLKMTTINLSTLHNYNLSVGLPLDLTSWWKMRQSADVFINKYNAAYLGQAINPWGLAANFTMNHNFMLPKGFAAELSGWYNTPGIDGMFRGRGFGQVSIGAQKSLWNKKATLRLNVNDIFNFNLFRGELQHANTHLVFRNRRESRVARLTFTYNFGNRNVKGVRQRRTGVEDEQRRIGQ